MVKEQISALESKQLELKAKMAAYDYINHKIDDARILHGAAAAKAVENEYKPKLMEREGLREEYNQNEATLKTLRAQEAQEAAEAAAAHMEPGDEPEPIEAPEESTESAELES